MNLKYDNEGEDQPGQAPLGTGDFTSEDGLIDPLAGGSSRKRINSSAILIAVVIVVAAGGLFSMRKLAELTAAATFDRLTEAAVEDFLRAAIGDAKSGPGKGLTIFQTDDEILRSLKEDRTDQQVAPDNVQKNPFIIAAIDLNRTDAAKPVAGPSRPQGPSLEQLQENRRTELRTAGQSMRVRSILGGNRPLAIIENEIKHIGDTVTNTRIGVDFTVVAIHTSSVDLEATDPALGVTVTITLNVHR